jgi:hypothetical protein
MPYGALHSLGGFAALNVTTFLTFSETVSGDGRVTAKYRRFDSGSGFHLRKFQQRVYAFRSHPHGLYQDGCCCFREKVSTHAIFSFRRLRALITPQPVGRVGLN